MHQRVNPLTSDWANFFHRHPLLRDFIAAVKVKNYVLLFHRITLFWPQIGDSGLVHHEPLVREYRFRQFLLGFLGLAFAALDFTHVHQHLSGRYRWL